MSHAYPLAAQGVLLQRAHQPGADTLDFGMMALYHLPKAFVLHQHLRRRWDRRWRPLSKRDNQLQRDRAWLPPLTDSVLVTQARMAVDHDHRITDGRWELKSYDKPAPRLSLASLGCMVPLAAVYARMTLPPEAAEGDACCVTTSWQALF